MKLCLFLSIPIFARIDTLTDQVGKSQATTDLAVRRPGLQGQDVEFVQVEGDARVRGD